MMDFIRSNLKKLYFIFIVLIITLFSILIYFHIFTTINEFRTDQDDLILSIIDIKGRLSITESPHFASNRTCATCHSDAIIVDCRTCHPNPPLFVNITEDFPHHEPTGAPGSLNCTASDCHDGTTDVRYINTPIGTTEYCDQCHAAGGSHTIHVTVNNRGPEIPITCTGCHGAYTPPLLSDGLDLTNTTVCNSCHSPGGRFDGVDNTSIGAKSNWVNGVYNETLGTLNPGMEKWCVGCHDNGSSTVNSLTAYDVGLFWTSTKVTNGTVDCESCHYTESGTHINSSSSDPNIKGNYIEDTYWISDPIIEMSVCWPCHNPDIYVNGSSGTNFPSHKRHIDKKDVACYACHETHAETNFVHQFKVIPVIGPIVDLIHYPAGGGECNAICHGAGWKSW
jgi:hypothetical protein